MLQLFFHLAELDFNALMEVYGESNGENAAERGISVYAQERNFEEYLREDFFTVPEAVYAVWAEDGIYRAALRLEPYMDGLLLEALETRPDSRRQGYARALIQAVQARLSGGKYPRLYSHIGKRNTASLAVHRACGFQMIQDSARYVDGTANTRAVTMCVSLRADKTEPL